jgi:hypothetical protein
MKKEERDWLKAEKTDGVVECKVEKEYSGKG